MKQKTINEIKKNRDKNMKVSCDDCGKVLIHSDEDLFLTDDIAAELVYERVLIRCDIHQEKAGHHSFNIDFVEPLEKVDMNITVGP